MSPVPVPWFSAFGIDANILHRVLAEAAAHGADDADLYFEHATSTSVALSDRAVNRAHTSIDLGVGVRVVIRDQVGYAYTEDLELESMLRAARTASEIARGGRARSPIDLQPVRIPDHYPLPKPWSDVSVTSRIPFVRRWEEEAFALDPRVVRVETSLADVDKHVLIATLDGRIVHDYRPMTRAFLAVSVLDGNLRETGHYNIASRSGLEFYDGVRDRRMVGQAVHRAVEALTAQPAPAGEMPVVLGAGSSGILLHEAIGHGMEADFNRKGISIYADKIGARIAPPGVTIVDDATLPSARGSLNVDDEAGATERTVLVEDGVLKTFLHDRISSRHYGVPSTGSGRRESFRHHVLPRMRCTYMEAGKEDPVDIIKGVSRGVYCDVFANGEVQIGAGGFSFYVRHGYLIEDGRCTRPIKDINIIGNGPDVLAAIEAVGNDLVIDEGGWTCGKDGQSVPVSQGMPTVRVAKLSVGGGAR
jgi:TldD protein